MKEFRTLRAEEIECRIGAETDKGVSLYLFKDARCDMKILDETVGVENWQKKYYEVGGRTYCEISIRNEETGEWISKQDVGESNGGTKDQGKTIASDAQKRAAVAWGIGRELYTNPFIWVKKENIVKTTTAGKCADKFRVSNIEYDKDKNITLITIINQNGTVVFDWSK